jgi:hypothetical protein
MIYFSDSVAIYEDKKKNSTFISNKILLGMVKDLNVFPFDNDMKKAHFGTKLCIYHEKTASVYQRNTIFTVYFKKSGN